MNIDGKMASLKKHQKNPLFGVNLEDYLTCKRMDV
jgi:hypothetical protein